MRCSVTTEGLSESHSVKNCMRIYRDEQRDNKIYARIDGKEVWLGTRDISVSRRKNGRATVVIKPDKYSVKLHNRSLHADDEREERHVEVVPDHTAGQTRSIPAGEVEAITENREYVSIKIGYMTTVKMSLEKEQENTHIEIKGKNPKVNTGDGEINIDESVDKSTNVDDSVVGGNSEIGSTGENRCEKHNRRYSEGVCPRCTCPSCGNTENLMKTFCPECGHQIAENS